MNHERSCCGPPFFFFFPSTLNQEGCTRGLPLGTAVQRRRRRKRSEKEKRWKGWGWRDNNRRLSLFRSSLSMSGGTPPHVSVCVCVDSERLLCTTLFTIREREANGYRLAGGSNVRINIRQLMGLPWESYPVCTHEHICLAERGPFNFRCCCLSLSFSMRCTHILCRPWALISLYYVDVLVIAQPAVRTATKCFAPKQ